MPAPRPVLAALGAALLLTACSADPQPVAPAPAATLPPAAPPAASSPDARDGAAPAGSVHLALGDSVAAGAGAPSGQGYVPLLTGLLRDALGCPDAGGAARCPVELVDLSVGGATTGTLLRDQLPEAVALLRSGRQVPVVTLTVGGNDVFGPVVRACAVEPGAASCRAAAAAALQAADSGLDQVLGGLAGAAGPGTTVAVMTYDDPLPACRLAPLAPLSAVVLEGQDGRPGLNDLVRARAAQHGAVVVETAGRLRTPDDFVGGDDCLHPSASGHRELAQAFVEALQPVLTD